MDILLLYFFTRMDSIHAAFGTITVLSGIAVPVVAFATAITCDGLYREEKEQAKKTGIGYVIRLLQVFFVAGFLYVMTPTTRDMAIIVGGHLAYEGVTSEYVTGTAKKIHELVNQELDEALASDEGGTAEQGTE